MAEQFDFTAKYSMISEEGSFRFLFFCGLCETTYMTGLIHATSSDEAFQIAAREARMHFNRCHQCGKWICDAHYNEDEMACTHCMPQMEQKTVRRTHHGK